MEEWQISLLVIAASFCTAFLWNISRQADRAAGRLDEIAAMLKRRADLGS